MIFDDVEPTTLLDVYYNSKDSVYVNRQGLPNTELCWRQIRGYSQTGGTFKHYIDQFNLVPTTEYPTGLFMIKSGGEGTSQVSAGTAYGTITVVPTLAQSNGTREELGYTTPPVYFYWHSTTGEGIQQMYIEGRMLVSDLDGQQDSQILPAINSVPMPRIPPEELRKHGSAINHVWRGKTLLANTQNSPIQKLDGGVVAIYDRLREGRYIVGSLYDGYLPYPPWEYDNPSPSKVIYSTRMIDNIPCKPDGFVGEDRKDIIINTPSRGYRYRRPMSYGVQWYILGQDADGFYGPTKETDEIKLGDKFPEFTVKKTPAKDVMVVIAVYIVIETADSYDPQDSATASGTKTYIVSHGIHTIGSVNSPETELTILEAGGVVGNLSAFGYTLSDVGASIDNSYIVVNEGTNLMVYALSKVHMSIPGGEFVLTGSHKKINFSTKNIIALVIGSLSTPTVKYFVMSGETSNRIAMEIQITEYKFYLFQRTNGVYRTLGEIVTSYAQIMSNDLSATGTLMVSGIKITSSLVDPMPSVSEVEYHHIQIEMVVFAPTGSLGLNLPNTEVVPPLTVDTTKEEATYDITKLLSTVPGFVSGNFRQLGNMLGFPKTLECEISLIDPISDPEEPISGIVGLMKPEVSMNGSDLKFAGLPTSASPLPFVGKAIVSTSIPSLLGTFSLKLTIDPEPPAFAPVFVYANTKITIDLVSQLVRKIPDNFTIGASRQSTNLRCSVRNEGARYSTQLGGNFQFTLPSSSTLTIDVRFTTAIFDCGDIRDSCFVVVEVDAYAYGTYTIHPPLMLSVWLIEQPTPVITWGPRTLLPSFVPNITTVMLVDGAERAIRSTTRLGSEWIPIRLDMGDFVVALPTDRLILIADFGSPHKILAYQCQHIVLPRTLTIDRFRTNGVLQDLELSVNDPPLMPVVLSQKLCMRPSGGQTFDVPHGTSHQLALVAVDADNDSCAIDLTVKINQLDAEESTQIIYGIAPTGVEGRTTDVSVATLYPIESFSSDDWRFLGYNTRNLFIEAQTSPSGFSSNDSYIFLRQSDKYKRHTFALAVYQPPVLKWVALGQSLEVPLGFPVSINGQWVSSTDDTLSDTAQDMVLASNRLTATKPTNAVVVIGDVSYNLRFFTPASPQTTLIISERDRENLYARKTFPNIKFVSQDGIGSTNGISLNFVEAPRLGAGSVAITVPTPVFGAKTTPGAYRRRFGASQYDCALEELWDFIAIVDDGLEIKQTVFAIAGGRTKIQIYKTYDLNGEPYNLIASSVSFSPELDSIAETRQGFIVKPQDPCVFDVSGTACFESSPLTDLSSQPFPPIYLRFTINVVVVPSPANTATNLYNVSPLPDKIPRLNNKPWFSMQRIGDNSQTVNVSQGDAPYVSPTLPFYDEYIGTDTSGITTRIRMIGINVPVAASTQLPAIRTTENVFLFNEVGSLYSATSLHRFEATLVSASDFLSVMKSGTSWYVKFKHTQDIELTGNITFAVDQEAIRIPITFIPDIHPVSFTVGTRVETSQSGTFLPAILGGLSMNDAGSLTGIAAVPGTYTFWQTTSLTCLRVTVLEKTAILDIYCRPNTTDTRQVFPVGSVLEDPLPSIGTISGDVMRSVSLGAGGLLTWTTGSLEGNYQFPISSQDIIINFVVANPIVYDTTTVYLNSDSVVATVDVESGCQPINEGIVASSSTAKPSEVFGRISCEYTGTSPLIITGRPQSTAVVKIGPSTITVKRWPTLMPIVHKTSGTFDTYAFGIVPASATLNVIAKMKPTTAGQYGSDMNILNEQDDSLGEVPYVIRNSTGIFLRYGPETTGDVDVVIRVEGTTPTSPDTIYAFRLIVSDADYLARINAGDQYFVGGQVIKMISDQFVAIGALPLPTDIEGLVAPYNTGYYKGRLIGNKLSPDSIRYIKMSSQYYYVGGTLISNVSRPSPTSGPIQAEPRDGPLVVHRVDVETLRDIVRSGQTYEGAQTVPPSDIFEGVTAVPPNFVRRSAHLLETQNAVYDFSSGLVSVKTKDQISETIEVIVRDSSYYTHYVLAVALNVMQPKPITITYSGQRTRFDIRDYIPYKLTNLDVYNENRVLMPDVMVVAGNAVRYYEGDLAGATGNKIRIGGTITLIQNDS